MCYLPLYDVQARHSSQVVVVLLQSMKVLPDEATRVADSKSPDDMAGCMVVARGTVSGDLVSRIFVR